MKAIDIAARFIGEKEMPQNSGFYNEELRKIMVKAGHKKGEAWCCYFAEACFCEAVKDTEKEKEFRKLFSASCVRTYNNFKESTYKLSKTPVEGALVLWEKHKNGNPTGFGHAGIVTKVIDDKTFMTIEGNTNREGSREGDSIQYKKRIVAKNLSGLNVLAFVILES